MSAGVGSDKVHRRIGLRHAVVEARVNKESLPGSHHGNPQLAGDHTDELLSGLSLGSGPRLLEGRVLEEADLLQFEQLPSHLRLVKVSQEAGWRRRLVVYQDLVARL